MPSIAYTANYQELHAVCECKSNFYSIVTNTTFGAATVVFGLTCRASFAVSPLLLIRWPSSESESESNIIFLFEGCFMS